MYILYFQKCIDMQTYGDTEAYLLLSHVCVFQYVHIYKECLLMFSHAAKKQGSLLQQAWEGGRRQTHIVCFQYNKEVRIS